MVKSEIIKKKLENGLTVIFLKNKEKTVLINVGVGIGSLSEKSEVQGVSHFLEHVLFEGSKKYPSYSSVKKSVDNINGDYNAFTRPNSTVYYIFCLRKNFEKELDIILDVIQNPLFLDDAIEKQRKIIFNELNQAEDQIQYQSMKFMIDSILSEGMPRINPMGSKESLAKITKKDLIEHYSTYYVPNNMVITISGDIEEPFALVEEKFCMKPRDFPKRVEPKIRPISGEVLVKLVKNTDTSYINQIYPTVPWKHEDSDSLKVISDMLCAGKFCIEDVIRQEHGLTYSCWARSMGSKEDGYFDISLSSGKENVFEIKELIKNHLKKLDNVSKKDVNKAKRNLVKEYRDEEQDPAELSLAVINNELENDWNEFYNRKEKILQVTREDVQRVAKKYFGNNYLISLIEQKKSGFE